MRESLLFFMVALSAGAAEKYPRDFVIPGMTSPYSKAISQLSVRPEFHVLKTSVKNLTLKCIQTPSHDFYVGVDQRQLIDAPIGRVTHALDDVNSYAQIFPDFNEIKVTSKDGNLWTTSWDQKVPVPFASDVRYDMLYLIVSAPDPRSDEKIYRYELKKSDDLIYSDGVILIQSLGPEQTSYHEVDFYDAHWGMAKVFGKEKLWEENLKGIALSDLGIKAKSEHPGDVGEWRNEEKALLKSQKVDLKCGETVKATDYFRGYGVAL